MSNPDRRSGIGKEPKRVDGVSTEAIRAELSSLSQVII
jgi:hypothetical protein